MPPWRRGGGPGLRAEVGALERAMGIEAEFAADFLAAPYRSSTAAGSAILFMAAWPSLGSAIASIQP